MDYTEINALAERASRGDKKAFESLYKEKFSSILYQAYTILGNHHDAEDVAQNVVLAMYKNIGKLKGAKSFNGWVHRMVTNECISYIRKKNVRKGELDHGDEIDIMIDERKEMLPEVHAENKELRQVLARIIRTLPEQRKRAIYLYYYEDLSYKEIAHAMDVSVSTVSTNILRARGAIRDAILSATGMDVDIEEKSV